MEDRQRSGDNVTMQCGINILPVVESDEIACPHDRSGDQKPSFSPGKGVLIPVNDNRQGWQSDADKSVDCDGEWVHTVHL